MLQPALAIAQAAADPLLEYSVVSRINALQRWKDHLPAAEETIAAMARISAHQSIPDSIRRVQALSRIQLLAMIDAKRGDRESAHRKAEAYFAGRERERLPPQREMTLGLIATYMRDYAGAANLLERAPELPEMSYLQYWLGVARQALGDRESARKYYQQVVLWNRLRPVDRLQLPLVRELAKRELSRLKP